MKKTPDILVEKEGYGTGVLIKVEPNTNRIFVVWRDPTESGVSCGWYDPEEEGVEMGIDV